jgi:hypothetical protein
MTKFREAWQNAQMQHNFLFLHVPSGLEVSENPLDLVFPQFISLNPFFMECLVG